MPLCLNKAEAILVVSLQLEVILTNTKIVSACTHTHKHTHPSMCVR